MNQPPVKPCYVCAKHAPVYGNAHGQPPELCDQCWKLIYTMVPK